VLYKLGKYDKALKFANEAIEIAKKSGDKYEGTEELIKKIESKQK
jgi:tetratricopeptide (TPR) repeat protein